jgi:hypothetical protein
MTSLLIDNIGFRQQPPVDQTVTIVRLLRNATFLERTPCTHDRHRSSDLVSSCWARLGWPALTATHRRVARSAEARLQAFRRSPLRGAVPQVQALALPAEILAARATAVVVRARRAAPGAAKQAGPPSPRPQRHPGAKATPAQEEIPRQAPASRLPRQAAKLRPARAEPLRRAAPRVRAASP